MHGELCRPCRKPQFSRSVAKGSDGGAKPLWSERSDECGVLGIIRGVDDETCPAYASVCSRRAQTAGENRRAECRQKVRRRLCRQAKREWRPWAKAELFAGFSPALCAGARPGWCLVTAPQGWYTCMSIRSCPLRFGSRMPLMLSTDTCKASGQPSDTRISSWKKRSAGSGRCCL